MDSDSVELFNLHHWSSLFAYPNCRSYVSYPFSRCFLFSIVPVLCNKENVVKENQTPGDDSLATAKQVMFKVHCSSGELLQHNHHQETKDDHIFAQHLVKLWITGSLTKAQPVWVVNSKRKIQILSFGYLGTDVISDVINCEIEGFHQNCAAQHFCTFLLSFAIWNLILKAVFIPY